MNEYSSLGGKNLTRKNSRTLVPNKWILYSGSTKYLEMYLFIYKNHEPLLRGWHWFGQGSRDSGLRTVSSVYLDFSYFLQMEREGKNKTSSEMLWALISGAETGTGRASSFVSVMVHHNPKSSSKAFQFLLCVGQFFFFFAKRKGLGVTNGPHGIIPPRSLQQYPLVLWTSESSRIFTTWAFPFVKEQPVSEMSFARYLPISVSF